MLLDERIGPLEKGDDVLQCMIASLTIRVAGIEARYRPSSGIGGINDWDDNDSKCVLAIREGLELGDNQPLNFFLRFCRFFHIGL
jgi:hypothetical protein